MTSLKKILLVDDERDILDFLSFNLENAGYEVKVAQNGVEGIKVAQEFLPDLILLDMMMPHMDGIQTCEAIRNLDTSKEIVVAFLTARGEDYSQIAGFEAGADDYILKPIKPKVLMSRVKALLKRIMDKIWGTEVVVGDRTIDVHIRKLREKFGDERIFTIKGVGYKYNG